VIDNQRIPAYRSPPLFLSNFALPGSHVLCRELSGLVQSFGVQFDGILGMRQLKGMRLISSVRRLPPVLQFTI
jgi:hypothetical protein